MPTNINVSVDVYQIGKAIADAVNANQNRPGFVKNLMETASFKLPHHNVMVFNLNQEYSKSLNGLVFYGSAVYDGITFGIWGFYDGEFTNHGDGGWINWAFTGWFERFGGVVKFTNPNQFRVNKLGLSELGANELIEESSEARLTYAEEPLE